MTARDIRVGIGRDSYPERRNITGSASGARYMAVPDQNHWRGRIHRRLTRAADRSGGANDREFIFRPFTSRNVDLFHLFNSISFGKTPWVTTFETAVPRFGITLSCHHGPNPGYAAVETDPQLHRAMAALASPSCRALLALSENCLSIQKELLSSFPEHEEAILRKLQTLHPPQPLLSAPSAPSAANRLQDDGGIRFVFVGNAFFRKGGREVLRVLDRLRNEGAELHLTLVSTIARDDYVGRVHPDEIASTRSWIERNSDWIEHRENLSHDDVTRILQRSQVGLLPTYADTYGYSVLEFQAAGCPVITTNVRALPEINPPDCGWMLAVPRNRLGEALYTTDRDRQALSAAVESGLEDAIRSILERPQSIVEKGEMSRQRIRRNHDPLKHGARLAQIYLNSSKE